MLNYKKYDEAICRLYAEMHAEKDKNDEIADNDLWELAERETDAFYMPQILALENTRSAIARASQPRNEAFIYFCKKLRQNQRLSDIQLETFAYYAKAETSCRFKTPVTLYCAIVDGKLYSVSSVLKRVRIEELTLL